MNKTQELSRRFQAIKPNKVIFKCFHRIKDTRCMMETKAIGDQAAIKFQGILIMRLDTANILPENSSPSNTQKAKSQINRYSPMSSTSQSFLLAPLLNRIQTVYHSMIVPIQASLQWAPSMTTQLFPKHISPLTVPIAIIKWASGMR
jgi:hypothetical protein